MEEDMNECQKELEALIDKHGLRLVAESVVEVCWAKAEHLAVNWQDTASAKIWQRIAMKIGNRVHNANLEWPS
jgi:hypothetical protein